MSEEFIQSAQNFLLHHLKNVGYVHDNDFETAFRNTNVGKIVSEKDASFFCLDNPILFYSSRNVKRPIPSPSMICAMVQELSVQEKSNVLIVGSDGGLIPAIISKIAKKGKVTVVEGNQGAFRATKKNIEKLGDPCNVTLCLADPLIRKNTERPWDRVLITGGIPDLPHEMREWVTVGGVIVAPIGERENQVMVRITKGENGELSEEAMGSVVFVELDSDKSKSIKPRIVETNDLNEFPESFMKYALVRDFPFPIAYVVRSFQNITDSHSKFTRLLDTHDVTTRFLAAVVICDLCLRGHRDRIQEMIKTMRLDLCKPSLGEWVGLLRGICNSLYDKIEKPFMPELKKGIPKSVCKKMDRFVEIRNKYHGHASTLEEDEYQDLVEECWPIMTEILYTFSFLKEYTLLVCDKMTFKDSKFNLTVRDLTGSHTDFATKILTSKRPMECEKVLLWRDRDGESLSLDPLIVFRRCPVCKNNEIFFYQSSKNGRSEYHGFQNNHKPLFEGDLNKLLG